MLKRLQTYLFYFMILVYISGAIGFILNPGFFLKFTPLTLLLTFAVFLLHQPFSDKRYLLSIFLIATITLSLELTGVHTGLVFGEYYYGNSLGPKIFGVPLVISLNWALLINCVVLLSSQCVKASWAVAFIAGGLLTLFDLMMEEVAPKMDMWYFVAGYAGLHNYLAWFFISFFIALLFQTNLKKGNWKLAGIVLLLQFLVFVSVYFAQLYTHQ